MYVRRLGGGTVLGLTALALLLGGAAPAWAGPYSPGNGGVNPLLVNGKIQISVDENGHGFIDGFGQANLPFALLPDPGPGGLPSVLTYNLLNPPGLVAGDVLMRSNEPGIGVVVFDVVRFNPGENGGSLLFYSDNVPTADSLGDTPSPPGLLYPNNITIDELGTEDNNGAIYQPLPGQPGFVAGAAAPVVYVLTSDGVFPLAPAVPEPSTLALLGLGGVGLAAWRRRRRTA